MTQPSPYRFRSCKPLERGKVAHCHTGKRQANLEHCSAVTPEQLGGSRSLTPERTRARGYPTVLQARARVWCSAAATANLLLAPPPRRRAQPQLTELSHKRNGWSVFSPVWSTEAQARVTQVLVISTPRPTYSLLLLLPSFSARRLGDDDSPRRTPREPGGPPDR